jgi:TM2 domain-containing membrane protein YozV
MSDEFIQSGNTTEVVTETVVSDKSKLAAALLCFFLGFLGVHRFYLGHVGSGVALLVLYGIGWLTTGIFIGFLFLGIAGIWEVVDFFRIIFGGMKDAKGRALK